MMFVSGWYGRNWIDNTVHNTGKWIRNDKKREEALKKRKEKKKKKDEICLRTHESNSTNEATRLFIQLFIHCSV